jgi:iron-sulfur cluster assembly protein
MQDIIKENKINEPLTLTSGAVKQLKQIMETENLNSDHGLRVGVKGGGCAGFSYILGFDTEKEGDDIFKINGVKVFMNRAHAIYLLGMEIDFQDGLNNRGFTFNNPNAESTCGCGTSFSA